MKLDWLRREIPEGSPLHTRLTQGAYRYPATITRRGRRLWFQFGFNRALSDEVKTSMEGAKWHGFEEPPVKQWSALDGQRTMFRLAHLEGRDPYARYNAPLLPYKSKRPLFEHQVEFVSHIITRQYCIGALEMGCGKTLAAIEAMEWLAAHRGIRGWFYVAPKSALTSVQIEFEKWRALVVPQFVTYDELKRIVANWPVGTPPPAGVIFDESSRCKNPTAQRTEAAQHLADSVREEWGENGAVVLMSGSPAPKSPLDWWSQCQIAMPGFLREGSLEKFRARLAVMAEGKSEAGGTFQKIVGWRDDEARCSRCGKYAADPDHDQVNMVEKWFHNHQPSVNEVALLYRRMAGLVMVRFKKDVLRDLPDKHYRTIRCRPTAAVINAARILVATGGAAVKVQTLLRELSDGFQYQEEAVGTEQCPACLGERVRPDWEYVGPDEDYVKMLDAQSAGLPLPATHFREVVAACSYCAGAGEVTKYTREAVQVPCPKEDVLAELIDEYEEVGRMVAYAGFTGSIDRVVATYLKYKWDVIRVDGRGWWSNLPGNSIALLKRFQGDRVGTPRMAFVGQPGAAGMGLNLTASPVIVYYSNDFNAESRIQSEDRIHRPGMDINLGATIVDLFNLPTDERVLDNLKKKRRLQDVTMGELRSALEGEAVRD